MTDVRFFSLALLLLAAGPAAAHAEFERAAPGRAEIVAVAPEVVTLDFSEPVEVRFSVFKVYPLDADATIGAETTTGTTETGVTLVGEELLHLNGLAGALVDDVIDLRDDEIARADAGVVTAEARSAEITLALKPDLPAGAYVVMWRVVSIDTHTGRGFYLFVIADPP